MRSLVLSDLHSNLEALEAVLAAARPLGCERVLVLGDIVGYGADPNGVVETLRGLEGLVAIRGNHDRAAVSLEEMEGFNEAARTATRWTHETLTEDNLAFLRDLPVGPREFGAGRILCHGTPQDEDEYLLDEIGAGQCFDDRPFALCFFGHSHYPGAFVLRNGRVERRPASPRLTTFDLVAGCRYLINPGSVGQPRDRNPDAGFAVHDDAAARVELHRIPYEISRARDKILRAGLPRALGDRLLLGA